MGVAVDRLKTSNDSMLNTVIYIPYSGNPSRLKTFAGENFAGENFHEFRCFEAIRESFNCENFH